MINPQERIKMMKAFQREPVYIAAVILKCVAALLIISGLALIGAGIGSTGDDVGRLQTQSRDNASASHRPTLHRQGQVRVEPM